MTEPLSPRTNGPMTWVERVFDRCVMCVDDRREAIRYNELLSCMLRLEHSHKLVVKALLHAERRLNQIEHNYAETDFEQITKALESVAAVPGDPEALAKLKKEGG